MEQGRYRGYRRRFLALAGNASELLRARHDPHGRGSILQRRQTCLRSSSKGVRLATCSRSRINTHNVPKGRGEQSALRNKLFGAKIGKPHIFMNLDGVIDAGMREMCRTALLLRVYGLASFRFESTAGRSLAPGRAHTWLHVYGVVEARHAIVSYKRRTEPEAEKDGRGILILRLGD